MPGKIFSSISWKPATNNEYIEYQIVVLYAFLSSQNDCQTRSVHRVKMTINVHMPSVVKIAEKTE